METKNFDLQLKSVSDAQGSFEGLLSPFGNIDEGGDVVERSAYSKTLKDQGPTRPLLWQHDTSMPIGELVLEERSEGLWCKGQLLMALPEAQKAYLLIKARIVKGLSIGFESIQDYVENGIRHLKEIRLYEGSIVTFPMNESATIMGVKQSQQRKKQDEEAISRRLQDLIDLLRAESKKLGWR